ncbi:hypothetical protein V6N13_141204 [Hibiscus sabdariffa]
MGRVFISRNVVFNENVFAYASAEASSSSFQDFGLFLSPCVPTTASGCDTEVDLPVVPDVPPVVSSTPSQAAATSMCGAEPDDVIASSPVVPQGSTMPSSVIEGCVDVTQEPATDPSHDSLLVSTGASSHDLPDDLFAPDATGSNPVSDEAILAPSNTHHMVTRSKVGVFKPKIFQLQYSEVPTSVHDALQHPEWKKAVMAEYNALLNNETWELVELSEGRKAMV